MVAVRGQSLWLPCNVPDLRGAAQIHREIFKELNKLKNTPKTSSDHYDPNLNQKPDKIGDSFENTDVPESDEDQFDSINDGDERDFYSDDDAIDTTDNIKKKNGLNKRKLNKKLEKKQLDNTKKSNKVLMQTSIEAEPDVPITYQWFLNDTEISLDDSKYILTENGTLHIMRFGGKRGSVQDIGKYHCSTSNSHGSVISTSVTANLAC